VPAAFNFTFIVENTCFLPETVAHLLILKRHYQYENYQNKVANTLKIIKERV